MAATTLRAPSMRATPKRVAREAFSHLDMYSDDTFSVPPPPTFACQATMPIHIAEGTPGGRWGAACMVVC